MRNLFFNLFFVLIFFSFFEIQEKFDHLRKINEDVAGGDIVQYECNIIQYERIIIQCDYSTIQYEYNIMQYESDVRSEVRNHDI